MKDKFQNILKKIKDLWNKYDKRTKVIAISAVSAVLIVLVVVLVVMNTTKYELLCSGLSDKEESQIYSAVSSKNIPVKVTGNSIYVKEGTANSLLMQLAEEGLPDGKLSYDIYSSGTNYAETDKDKDIKQIHQIQNRLQDTIETIPGVKQAIVNIASNSNDTYVLDNDKTPTTASVKLSLRDGTALSKAQVNGIVQLVAHSVPGLSTDNITVADSDGNALNGEMTGTDETADQLLMKSKYESSIKSKIVDMLSQVYGKGNVNVVVNADIDYSKVSTVTNSYTSGVASVVTNGSEVSYAGSSLASGVTGVSGAQPAYPNTSNNNSVATYSSKASTTTSYAVGSVQEAISRVGGKLNKLSIAVILNNKNAAAANADTDALKSTIANAAGANVDDISVEQMGFSSLMPSSSTISQGFTIPSIGTVDGRLVYMIIAAFLLIIVLTTLFLVLGHKRKRRREMLEEQALEEAEAEAQAAAAAQLAPGEVPVTSDGKPAIPLKSIEETINETQDNSYKKQIEDFADKKPELVAQILKNWLKD